MEKKFEVNVKQKMLYVISYVKDPVYEFEVAVSQSEYEEEQKFLEFYLCKKDYGCRSFIVGLLVDKAELSDDDKTINVILNWLSSLFESGHIDDDSFLDLDREIEWLEENRSKEYELQQEEVAQLP